MSIWDRIDREFKKEPVVDYEEIFNNQMARLVDIDRRFWKLSLKKAENMMFDIVKESPLKVQIRLFKTFHQWSEAVLLGKYLGWEWNDIMSRYNNGHTK